MEPIETNELRVVKSKGIEFLECGTVGPHGYVDGAVSNDGFPTGVVLSVQRKWLVLDGEPYTRAFGPDNKDDIFISGTMANFTYQPMRIEWRDLPEAP